MTTNQIIELLPRIEIQVCGILIENGICEYIQKPRDNSRKDVHNRFQNLKFTSSSVDGILVTDENIQSLRALYPKTSDRKGDLKTIRNKATRWLTENSTYTFQDILEVTKKYVYNEMNNSGGDMLFNLNNIFYKLDQGKYEKSPMSALFEKYSKEESNEVDELNIN